MEGHLSSPAPGEVVGPVLWKCTESPESFVALKSASEQGCGECHFLLPADGTIPLLFCNPCALGAQPPGNSAILPTEEGPPGPPEENGDGAAQQGRHLESLGLSIERSF